MKLKNKIITTSVLLFINSIALATLDFPENLDEFLRMREDPSRLSYYMRRYPKEYAYYSEQARQANLTDMERAIEESQKKIRIIPKFSGCPTGYHSNKSYCYSDEPTAKDAFTLSIDQSLCPDGYIREKSYCLEK